MYEQEKKEEIYRTTRPNVTKEESIALAQRLFLLRMNPGEFSEVQELDSYEDRNFLLKGTLQEPSSQEGNQYERHFVLKVTNSLASRNRDLQSVTTDLLPFINSKAIQCPVPQTSIFGTKIVFCRIQEPVKSDEDGNRLSCSSNIDKDHMSVREATKGIQVASKEEENMDDVCAVQLMSFVYGELLCDVDWTRELLVDFGSKVARFHKILQDYSQANNWIKTACLQQSLCPWPITNFAKGIRKYCSALQDKQREAIVQDIIKRLQSEVLEQLNPHDLQLIHADLNEHNVIVGPNSNGQMKIKGFIDFNEMDYSYKLLCIGIALGYLMIEANKKNFDVIDACSHLLAGYQSEMVLVDSDIDKLLVVAKARICQSLVLGAYHNQISPDNTYLLYTHKSGLEVLDKLRLIPECDILRRWKSIQPIAFDKQ